MRTVFHGRLDSLIETLSEMCGLAGLAMEQATHALLQADLNLAEKVIADHEHLAQMQTAAEEAAFVLLALQAPVAADLRIVVGSMQNVADAERMGGLARHVAEIVRRRHPEHTLPAEVNDCFAEMGRSRWTWATAPKTLCYRVIPNGQRRSAVTMKSSTNFTSTCSLCSKRQEWTARRGVRRRCCAAGPVL